MYGPFTRVKVTPIDEIGYIKDTVLAIVDHSGAIVTVYKVILSDINKTIYVGSEFLEEVK